MLTPTLLPNPRGGGSERVSIGLAGALAALGQKVEFVLMRVARQLAEAKARRTAVSLDAYLVIWQVILRWDARHTMGMKRTFDSIFTGRQERG